MLRGKASAPGNFGSGEELNEKGQFKNHSIKNGFATFIWRLLGYLTVKPIIGAIEGPAIGGGLGLAMVADFGSLVRARFQFLHDLGFIRDLA